MRHDITTHHITNEQLIGTPKATFSPHLRLCQDKLGKMPTYPSHKLTLTLTSRLGQNVGLGEGQVISFPET